VAEVAAVVPTHDCSVEQHLIAQQQVAEIWQTVNGLSSRQRSIFLLRFLEEMEIPEIASVTGLPLGTVKSHLYRALAIIRSQHNRSAQSTAHNSPESNANTGTASSKETR
jgi:RNA polymerase sigma-70 factor (ECF subfamily)